MWSACIGGDRRSAATSDSGETDTTREPSDTVEPDVTLPFDVADVDVDVILPDTTTPDTSVLDTRVPDAIVQDATSDVTSCDGDGDCVPANAPRTSCVTYTCMDHTCQATPVADDTPCDDRVGLPYDECNDGWYGYVDSCQGGHCQAGDGFVPEHHPMLGAWYAVIARTTNQQLDTLRTAFSVNEQGGISVSSSEASDAAWRGALSSAGFTCVSHPGRINLGHGSTNYAGYRNPSDDTFIFGGLQGSEIGLAVRPLGDTLDVDGSYTMIATTSDGVGQHPHVVNRLGMIQFDAGCVSHVSPITTAGAAVFVAKGEPHCVSTPVGSGSPVVHLTMTLLPRAEAAAAEGKSETWRGVIARQGALLLMTVDAGNNTTPLFGTIVLVREPTNDFPIDDGLAERWAFLSERSPADDNVMENPSVRWGLVELQAGGSALSGTLEDLVGGGSEPIRQSWYLQGQKGRYYQRVDTSAPAFYAGVTAFGSDLVVGFVATPPPGDPTLPGPLSDTPAEGSLLLMTPLQHW